MSNHTPGPWYATSLRTHGANPKMNGCDIGAQDGSNVAIAFHEPVDRSESETVANARILAAAPEMYQTLKEIERRALSRLGYKGSFNDELIALTEKIIAKAEGETR